MRLAAPNSWRRGPGQGTGGIAEGDLADSVLATLRSLETELRTRGVVELSPFGSVARGEAHAGSDMDLAIRFDKAARFSLVDMAGQEIRLAEALGRPVELSTLPIENPWTGASVERDGRVVS